VDIHRGLTLGSSTLGSVESTTGFSAFDPAVFLDQLGKELAVRSFVLVDGSAGGITLGDLGNPGVLLARSASCRASSAR